MFQVTIHPEVTNKRISRDIIKTLQTSFCLSHLGGRQIAYDGSKSIYTPGELPFQSKDFVVKLDEKDGGAG